MKKNKKETLLKLSKQELNAYHFMHDEDTPNLWDRIEAGFEEEVNPSENTIKYENKLVSLNKRVKRMRLAAVIAACVLITVVTIPVIIFSNGSMGRKSETDHIAMDTNAGESSDVTDKGMVEENDTVSKIMSDEINSSDESGEDVAGKSEQTDSEDNYEYVDKQESMSENGEAPPTESLASTELSNMETGSNAQIEDTETDFDAFMGKYESCMQVMKRFME